MLISQKSVDMAIYLDFARYILRAGKKTTDFHLLWFQRCPFLSPLIFCVTGYLADGQMHLKRKA